MNCRLQDGIVESSRSQERGAKGRFAAIRAQDLQADRIKVGPKKGGRFITGRSAKDSQEGLLRELLGLRRISKSPPEESKQRLLVPGEQLAKGFFRSPGEGEHQDLVASCSCRPLGVRTFGLTIHHHALFAFESRTNAGVATCIDSPTAFIHNLVMSRVGKKFRGRNQGAIRPSATTDGSDYLGVIFRLEK